MVRTAGDDTFEANRRTVESRFLPKLRSVLRRVPFAEDLLAAYYVALDRDVPMRVRAIILGALAYFVLPMDAIPDFMVGLGFTDDAAVFFAAYKVISSSIGEKHREAARRWLNQQDIDV